MASGDGPISGRRRGHDAPWGILPRLAKGFSRFFPRTGGHHCCNSTEYGCHGTVSTGSLNVLRACDVIAPGKDQMTRHIVKRRQFYGAIAHLESELELTLTKQPTVGLLGH